MLVPGAGNDATIADVWDAGRLSVAALLLPSLNRWHWLNRSMCAGWQATYPISCHAVFHNVALDAIGLVTLPT